MLRCGCVPDLCDLGGRVAPRFGCFDAGKAEVSLIVSPSGSPAGLEERDQGGRSVGVWGRLMEIARVQGP